MKREHIKQYAWGIGLGMAIVSPFIVHDVQVELDLSPTMAPTPLISQVQEDQPGWSCVDDGNRICGPGNAQGAPAGCYDDGGVLVAAWPCHVVVNSAGDADVYADS